MEDITENGKYYLATEESFIPGLIYELYNFTENRFEVQPPFSLRDFSLYTPVILNQLGTTCLIKFLSSEDIIECGWIKQRIGASIEIEDQLFQLLWDENPNMFVITKNGHWVFNGKILNKSELKFQMERLGITK